MRSLKSLSLIVFCAFVLAACGLKGPLYLPDDSSDGRSAPQQQTDKDKKDTDEADQDDDGN
ncbi:MAG: lipoprotein [Lysobacterales bacterium]|jgi:predicted small lipoprotein YifL